MSDQRKVLIDLVLVAIRAEVTVVLLEEELSTGYGDALIARALARDGKAKNDQRQTPRKPKAV